jgi:hypothetical protein
MPITVKLPVPVTMPSAASVAPSLRPLLAQADQRLAAAIADHATLTNIRADATRELKGLEQLTAAMEDIERRSGAPLPRRAALVERANQLQAALRQCDAAEAVLCGVFEGISETGRALLAATRESQRSAVHAVATTQAGLRSGTKIEHIADDRGQWVASLVFPPGSTVPTKKVTWERDARGRVIGSNYETYDAT